MSKRIVMILPGITLLLLLTSCFNAIIGSGPVVTKESAVGQFDSIDVSHAFNVRVTRSDQCRVQIRTNENLIPHLLLENDGGILRIGFRHGVHITNTTSEAIIEMPSIREIHFSGATNGELIGDWSMPSLRVDLSGASRIQGRIMVENLKADLSGASSVNLQGSGNTIDLSGSGASGFEMRDFDSGDATVDMSGASHAVITTNGNLNCQLSGASSVRYRGEPKLGTLNTSGASSVHRD
jgi:hypothetical protein